LFVDRVFSLEHNGGCFLNKLDWANHRRDRDIAHGHSTVDNYMKYTVLEAHASDPINIDVLYNHASKEVQKLLVSYFDLAKEHDMQVQGKWKGSVGKAVPVIDVYNETSSINWDDDSEEEEETETFFNNNHLKPAQDTFKIFAKPMPSAVNAVYPYQGYETTSFDYSNLGIKTHHSMKALTLGTLSLPSAYCSGHKGDVFNCEMIEVEPSMTISGGYFVRGVVEGMVITYHVAHSEFGTLKWFKRVANAALIMLEDKNQLPDSVKWSSKPKAKASSKSSTNKSTDVYELFSPNKLIKKYWLYAENEAIFFDKDIDKYTGNSLLRPSPDQ